MTSTGDSNEPNSGDINGGAFFSHTFDQAGVFTYWCTIHRSMTGTITVN